jgi:hypothetical protein
MRPSSLVAKFVVGGFSTAIDHKHHLHPRATAGGNRCTDTYATRRCTCAVTASATARYFDYAQAANLLWCAQTTAEATSQTTAKAATKTTT